MTGSAAEVIGAAAVVAAAAGLAAGGFAYASRWPASRIFGAALTAPRNPAGGLGELALTFDDGPNPRWTPLLLDSLDEHRVHATFFLLGKYAAAQKPLVRRMHEAGHLIGNHTWSHPSLALTSAHRTREELAATNAELEQMLGAPVRYFRPPYGSRRPATLHIARELGLVPVLWNAMTADWSATDSVEIANQLAAKIEKRHRSGFAANIVLHDGGHASIEADRSASVGAAALLMKRYAASHRFVTLDAWPVSDLQTSPVSEKRTENTEKPGGV